MKTKGRRWCNQLELPLLFRTFEVFCFCLHSSVKEIVQNKTTDQISFFQIDPQTHPAFTEDEMAVNRTVNDQRFFVLDWFLDQVFDQNGTGAKQDAATFGPRRQLPQAPQSGYVLFTDARDESNALYTDEKYQIGAAIGWGGAQLKDNIYELSGDYSTDKCYQLTFEDPGNRAFWSITVYDKNGFMFDDLANYSSNTATPNADGTYTVSFGCGNDAPNNLKIDNPTNFFNIAVRHYQPSERVVNEDYRLVPFMQEVAQ